MIRLRVGIGYDVHCLVEGRDLILGGVRIPYKKGLEGHSDADVLCHALMDALLGAAGMEDIGVLFPPESPDYKGADSLKLLAEVVEKLEAKGFKVINVDSVICAQAPKLLPYRQQMRQNLAEVLGLKPENVGVKATTTERLGFEGRGEGISAQSVALLQAELTHKT